MGGPDGKVQAMRDRSTERTVRAEGPWSSWLGVGYRAWEIQ